MRDISEAGGLSTGTINYRFTNKRNLNIAAMDAVYSLPLDWEADAHLPALAQLRRMEQTFVLDNETLRRWCGHRAVRRSLRLSGSLRALPGRPRSFRCISTARVSKRF